MIRTRGRWIFRLALLCVPLLLLTGCQQAPAFNVLGSYFPAWLFCLCMGMVLTVGARVFCASITSARHLTLRF